MLLLSMFCILVALSHLSSGLHSYDWHCKLFPVMKDFPRTSREFENNVLIVVNMYDCDDCFVDIKSIEKMYLRLFQHHKVDIDLMVVTKTEIDSPEYLALTNEVTLSPVMPLDDELDPSGILSQGRVFIFDQCSRLTFKFPLEDGGDKIFVNTTTQQELMQTVLKASILATVNDEICGTCEDFLNEYFYRQKNSRHYAHDYDNLYTWSQRLRTTTPLPMNPKKALEEIYMKYNNFDEVNDIDLDYVVPLRVIFPSEHVHKSPGQESYEKYKYIVLHSNETGLNHTHLQTDQQETVLKDGSSSDNDTRYASKDNQVFKALKQYVEYRCGREEVYEEVVPLFESEFIVPTTTEANKNSEIDGFDLLAHIKHWVNYILRK